MSGHGNQKGGGHGHSHHHHEHHHHCCSTGHCGHCECCSEHSDTDNHHRKKKDTPVNYLVWIVLCTLLSIATLTFAALWFICATTPVILHEPLAGCTQIASGSSGGINIVPTAKSITVTPTRSGSRTVSPPNTAFEWLDVVEEQTNPTNPDVEPRNMAVAATLAIAVADGSPIAYPLFNGVSLSQDERAELPLEFMRRSNRDGALGFYRIALTYLGLEAFDIARLSPPTKPLYVPFCQGTTDAFVPAVNAAVFPTFQFRVAYMNLALIAQGCQISGKPDAEAWMDAIRKKHPELAGEFIKIETEVPQYLDRLMKFAGEDPEDQLARNYFCLGGLYGKDDHRNAGRCEDAQNSRQALKYGDAADADNDKEKARACWRKAIELAKPGVDGTPPVDPDGAPAAILAQKRLQTNETTCKWTPDSLAAISRDYKARSGDLIHVRVLQQSLKSLGHYDGDLDGQLSPQTRAAVRKFQRELGEDETDTLTPVQIVRLVCSAAETARDPMSETTLGIMYATGLGVERNMDRSHYWLMSASNQHYPDATYKLSILYGTGIVLDSYRLCDVPRAPEQADKYLQEAAEQGQSIAKAMMKMYGPGSTYGNLSPRERWALIELQQLEHSPADRTALYAHMIAPIGTKCAPDRNTR